MIEATTLTCPECDEHSAHTMPADACLIRLAGPHCSVVLRPPAGNCRVFCSYDDVLCPPIQQDAEPPKKDQRKKSTDQQPG